MATSSWLFSLPPLRMASLLSTLLSKTPRPSASATYTTLRTHGFRRLLTHSKASLRYSTASTTGLTMTPPIAIIGAGPCGLTLARLLERNNIDYVLYERDIASASAHHKKIGVGGSLDLHPGTGQRALEVAGLFDQFKKHARYDATGFKVATQDGEIKLSIGEGRDAPEIDRSQLRQMLLDSVSAANLQWDHGVKAVERDNSSAGWNIKFANGSSQGGFKLVVGTDGAWSKVRPVVRKRPFRPSCLDLDTYTAHS